MLTARCVNGIEERPFEADGRMMRSLFVTVDSAFPPVSGAELRVWQNVRAAGLLGPVLLLSVEAPRVEVLPGEIRTGKIDGMERSDIWASDFDPTFSDELIASFRAAAYEFRPDVTVLESLPLAKLISTAREEAASVTMDLHNIESDLVLQQLDWLTDPVLQEETIVRANRIRSIEREVTLKADAVWVCSCVDRDRLLKVGNTAPLHIVPNGIPRFDEILERVLPDDYGKHPVLLFVGHLGYAANVEAALLLVQMMPAIWQAIPGARLVLAGRNPHSAVLYKSRPGKIDVVANPRSVCPLLRDAQIAVMPLQRGGGTRIKALEAIAWGIPLVATARAVEGLNLQNGLSVSLAEDRDSFVAAIIKLCSDRNYYESQAKAAKDHILDYFGPQAVNAAVREALQACQRATSSNQAD